MTIEVTKDRYSELSNTLTKEELSAFSIFKPLIINEYQIIATTSSSNISFNEVGGFGSHIYKADYAYGFVVPVAFDSLEKAKTFCNHIEKIK